MGEENRTKESNESQALVPSSSGVKVPEFTLDSAKNEITFRDSTGKTATIKGRIIEKEKEEDEEEYKEEQPLTPEQFRTALEKVDDLGLAWSAGRPPAIKAKDESSDDALFSEDFERLQEEYPGLPREVGVVVFYALTGMPISQTIAGRKEDLDQKAAIVQELVITPEYRSEFFFRHAIKVPYFESIDWEVIVKTHERNVYKMPAIGYALLMLTFHNTNPKIGKLDEHQNVTVAVDLPLVKSLMATLENVKAALEDTKELTDILADTSMIKGENDARSDNEQQ